MGGNPPSTQAHGVQGAARRGRSGSLLPSGALAYTKPPHHSGLCWATGRLERLGPGRDVHRTGLPRAEGRMGVGEAWSRLET